MGATVGLSVVSSVGCSAGQHRFTVPVEALKWVVPTPVTLVCEGCGLVVECLGQALVFAPFGGTSHPVLVLVAKETR